MVIYTRTGDDGTTALPGGRRVPKSDPAVELLGALDEANAALGVARAEAFAAGGKLAGELAPLLDRAQADLLDLGAALFPAAPKPAGAPAPSRFAVDWMERELDRLAKLRGPRRGFVLPGGTRPAAALELARTVVRRAERRLDALAATPGAALPMPGALRAARLFLNRLGDLAWELARRANALAGEKERPWAGG